MVARPRPKSNKTIIPQTFYARDARMVARALIGTELVHETPDGLLAGRIVETEAYLADDPASHSFRGQTLRTVPMFGPAGHVYIYFTYGMHWCLNIVTGGQGVGEAVLIRALEPTDGLTQMQVNRGRDSIHELCNGPAKLVQAMGITSSYNGADLTVPPLYLRPRIDHPKIITTTRIGIKSATELPYRFYVADNTYISKK